ncbi:uncharacterized protein LOC119016944 [Acanthopagrus latus]|uniref:uncharacterized protein LOC119016129 n=1 Tax=Acanthopagrus latus TaxID=8177 RepID=UPI00187C1C76|nr:uncharacterized protein LOC119016129 [Acanthopagrus latus]XP_036948076.1 uncharacterized protein LOC119016402 [Acanthopagrus latus]XP_036949218.1 uncharacterized protein LOC119016944 [Acanthopagrus latus]
MALKSLLNTKSPNQYFHPPPLKILVLRIIDAPKVISWDFSKTVVTPATTKFNKVAIFSDGQTCTKVTIFQEFGDRIKEGYTYIMRGHTIRGSDPPYYLNINERTMFFRTTNLEVTEELYQQAEALLYPASPLTPLFECLASKGLMTVEGQVIEVLPVKKVTLGGHCVPLKKVMLEQGSDKMELCLWREAATEQVQVGERLTVTHLKVTKNGNLQSTVHTAFKKPETEVKEGSILGVMEQHQDEGFLQILLDDDSIYTIRKELWSPLNEQLVKGPIRVVLTTEGGEIINIITKAKEE